MQIRTRIKTAKPESEFDRTLEQELLSGWNELSQAINGGLKFEDNFNAAIVTVSDTGTAGVEFSAAHGLKRVPIGFLVISRTGTGVVYNGASAWTSSSIYLKCTTNNNNIKLLIF